MIMSIRKSLYRLASLDGNPHPVLDTTYDSLEAAITEAKNWFSQQENIKNIDLDKEEGIGVEILTSNGSWRTLCYQSYCIQDVIPC